MSSADASMVDADSGQPYCPPFSLFTMCQIVCPSASAVPMHCPCSQQASPHRLFLSSTSFTSLAMSALTSRKKY